MASVESKGSALQEYAEWKAPKTNQVPTLPPPSLPSKPKPPQEVQPPSLPSKPKPPQEVQPPSVGEPKGDNKPIEDDLGQDPSAKSDVDRGENSQEFGPTEFERISERVNDLELATIKLESFRRITFGCANLVLENGQALIDKYGAENFINAIDNVLQNQEHH